MMILYLIAILFSSEILVLQAEFGEPKIRKCCPRGKYLKRKICIFHSDESASIKEFQDEFKHFQVVVGSECENGQRRGLLDPQRNNDSFIVENNGRLTYYNNGNKKETYIFPNFCVEHIEAEDSPYKALVCAYKKQHSRSNIYGMIISTPFLLATLIAYALLPDRNLHMKALMSYVFNLLMGYILLVSIQLSQHFSELGCSTIAFCCVFFFMASFFWMNVICIDIWLGFSGLRQISGMKTAETKRFLYYCLYAWGMAVLLVLAVILIDKYAPHDSWYHPEVGRAQCFIRDGTPQLLYFYGPMGIVITINVILFALTALKIRKVKKDTSMLKHSDSKRHSYESDKQRFNLYLKLLFAMGVNWSMELISWAVNLNVGLPQYIWYFTDFCNAVYGVFIFFIFVFKKNIWRQLKRRYYSFMGKPHFAHSMTTNPTSVTSYSTTVSNHDNANTDTSELTTRIS
uniref:G-protein coupled receptor Mth-like 2-4 protein n=1 Tax=Dastarcus helophoroides TaxID=1169899 RepID=A0A2Z5H045_9CUCU|nr:G-protein coupled receptor Mth-like 2-4 protein [Dastarcus helophoroides]